MSYFFRDLELGDGRGGVRGELGKGVLFCKSLDFILKIMEFIKGLELWLLE